MGNDHVCINHKKGLKDYPLKKKRGFPIREVVGDTPNDPFPCITEVKSTKHRPAHLQRSVAVGVLFGCFALKNRLGFRFLAYLVTFSHLPGKPIYSPKNPMPAIRGEGRNEPKLWQPRRKETTSCMVCLRVVPLTPPMSIVFSVAGIFLFLRLGEAPRVGLLALHWEPQDGVCPHGGPATRQLSREEPTTPKEF